MNREVRGSERNVRCPQCNKKLKSCQCKPAMKLWLKVCLLILALMVLAALVYVGIGYKKRVDEQRYKASISKIINDMYEYIFKRNNKDVWWFESAYTRDFSTRAQKLEESKKSIINVLEKYKDTNDLMKRIAKNFKTFYTSVYLNGVSQKIYLEGDSILSSESYDIEICFISKDQRKGHPSSMYYNSGWKALLISGVRHPDILFAAILCHELGHALFHIVDKAPSAVAEPGSDLFIHEEVVMHELEADIIDKGTNGKYYQYVDNLIASLKGKKNFVDILEKIGVQDLRELDKITGAEQYGPAVARNASSEYFITIGFRFIDQWGGGRLKRKIEFYRWFTATFK
ncbi:hypothetical protein KJ554_14715 [bacterium]|nr:hypothetical protein [bacterium]